MSYNFTSPTVLDSGVGQINNLTNYLSTSHSKKVLIVTDKGIMKIKLLSSITEQLNNLNIPYCIFDGVLADAPDYTVDEAVKIGKKNHVDLIISVGGGSTIDTAKATQIALSLNENFRNYLGTFSEINQSLMTHIAIPTTAGTGSEVSFGAVITDTTTNTKKAIMSAYIAPTIAIVDANMMKTLPNHITVATSLDALTHLMETVFSTSQSPISNALSYEGTKLIIENLPIVLKDGTNIDARQSLANASSMAAIAFSSTMLHVAHTFAHAVGAKWHIPHGIGCAWGLVYTIEYLADVYPDKTRIFAQIFNVDNASTTNIDTLKSQLKDQILEFYSNVKLPKLSEFKSVDKLHFDEVANDCLTELNTGFVHFTPKVPNREFFMNILENVY